MSDIFTPEKRSWVMSRIRGTNTKIDLRMNDMLKGTRYKYEMYPKMFGHPDFVLPRKRIVIFCDGDFWHGYKYHEKKKPAKKFWREKIERNMKRDVAVSRRLRTAIIFRKRHRLATPFLLDRRAPKATWTL